MVLRITSINIINFNSIIINWIINRINIKIISQDIDIIRSIVINIIRNISIINIIITVNVGNAKTDPLVRINAINGQHRPRVELNEPIDERTDLHRVIVATIMTVRTSTDVERKSIIQNGTAILHQAIVVTNPTVVLPRLMNRQIG